MAITREQLKVGGDYLNYNEENCTILFLGEEQLMYKAIGSEWCIAIHKALKGWSLPEPETKTIKVYEYLTEAGTLIEYEQSYHTIWKRTTTPPREVTYYV